MTKGTPPKADPPLAEKEQRNIRTNIIILPKGSLAPLGLRDKFRILNSHQNHHPYIKHPLNLRNNYLIVNVQATNF